MNKFLWIAFMAMCTLQAQNIPLREKTDLLATHQQFLKEKWGYVQAKIQKEAAYNLYTREKKMTKLLDKGLRILEVYSPTSQSAAVSTDSTSIVDSLRRFFLNNKELFDHDISHSSQLTQLSRNDYNGLEAHILTRSQIEAENNAIGSVVNEHIRSTGGIGEQEDYFQFISLAQKALLHKNKYYLVVYRCFEKESEMLDLVRQELKPFDMDSLRTVISESYDKSFAALDTIQPLGDDKELRDLTENILEFYKTESTYLLDATEEYYRQKKAFNGYHTYFKKLDIRKMDQETYDEFKKRLIAITNAQTDWRDKRDRFSRIRNENHLEWNEKSQYFVENFLFERVPTYRKPTRNSIWAQK